MRILPAVLISFGVACAPARAGDTPEERAFFVAAFQTARDYGADMSLLSYCLRGDEEISARLTLGVIGDLSAVFEKVKQGALDPRRSAEFFREALASIHFASREASDPALDKACADRHVLDAYAKLQPIAWPITMRAPFAAK